MRNNISKLSLLTLIFSSVLFFTSCEKEVLTDGISSDEALKSAQVDVASDEVDGLVEDEYMMQESIVGRSDNQMESSMPACVTRTVVNSGLVRTVTLDFGLGCDMPNGNHLSGIITMVWERNPTAQSRTITFSYTNFTFNGIGLAGGGSIVRVLHNASGNPQATATVDVTATFLNDGTAHRTGTRVREWIQGFGTPTWLDNVFSVTGNWSTEFSNGNINTGLVTTPLRREATCPFFVSGVVELSHNGNSGTLDFGDGTCDNVATFTGPNGVVHTIRLRR